MACLGLEVALMLDVVVLLRPETECDSCSHIISGRRRVADAATFVLLDDPSLLVGR